MQDTDDEDELVQDEEINYILTLEDNVYRAAAKVAKAIAAKFSRLANEDIGDYSISYSDLSDKYLKLASSLEEQAKKDLSLKNIVPYAGGISKSDKKTEEEDADRVKPFFERDLFTNLKNDKS